MFVLVLAANITSDPFAGKAKLQAEEDAEVLLEEQQWQASRRGGQDVNNLFDDKEQQEMDDDPSADFNDAELAVEDEFIDNERVQPVLGKHGRPRCGESQAMPPT
jgi:hypothetical protein